ncbi:MAG: ABC transporter permease [Dehalococcoidia bacterium]|jgi:oligopeptide transport system permease protein|nr:ABC transporter permease [Dehalococcoidia bacterium]
MQVEMIDQRRDPSMSGPSGFYGQAWLRLKADRAAMISLTAIVCLMVVAVFADVIAPYGTSEQLLTPPSTTAASGPLAARDTGKYETPTADHLFGTDALGRDIFSRTVVGLRISLSAAIFAIVAVTLLGVVIGTISAAGPPIVDRLLMRITDVAFAFPGLLLIILLRSVFGTEIFGRDSIFGLEASVLLLFLAISLTAWPAMARVVRGQLLSIRETEYTEAAISLGASKTRIAVRHWLPNAMGPVIVHTTFLVPEAIFAEAALSFIGVGVSPPTPSLGVLINEHFRFVSITWSGLFFPTTVLAILFIAFNFFGDGLRDALDPRSKR